MTMTLDRAWAAAEAELPDGWKILSLRYLDGQWRVMAGSGAPLRYRQATGLTPATALIALAGRFQAEPPVMPEPLTAASQAAHPHDGYAYDGCVCMCCLNVRALLAAHDDEPVPA